MFTSTRGAFRTQSNTKIGFLQMLLMAFRRQLLLQKIRSYMFLRARSASLSINLVI